jgi:transposase InsO family protein
MDLFDRKIIGWSLADNMSAEATVLAAWRMATTNRSIENEMIFHSDRGVQYASESFRKELSRFNVIQSMSRKGNCWDNAVAENFFKILKSEMVNHNNYQSYFQARIDIFEFIEIWYNRQRLHSYLRYLSPYEFGKTTIKQVA